MRGAAPVFPFMSSWFAREHSVLLTFNQSILQEILNLYKTFWYNC